jgi:hypothetical protein
MTLEPTVTSLGISEERGKEYFAHNFFVCHAMTYHKITIRFIAHILYDKRQHSTVPFGNNWSR